MLLSTGISTGAGRHIVDFYVFRMLGTTAPASLFSGYIHYCFWHLYGLLHCFPFYIYNAGRSYVVFLSKLPGIEYRIISIVFSLSLFTSSVILATMFPTCPAKLGVS